MAKKNTSTSEVNQETDNTLYFKSVDNGETIYKEWLFLKREGDVFEKWMQSEDVKKNPCLERLQKVTKGVDLVVYAHVKKEFLTEKLQGKSIDDYNSPKLFVEELAKNMEIGRYFHNPKGVNYGALYKDLENGEKFYPHEEYWINGKRLTDQAEIKKIIYDANFTEKANEIINGPSVKGTPATGTVTT